MEVVRKFWFVVLALCSLANLSRSVLAEAPYEVEDIDIDANCFSSAKLGDHLLFEYEFKYANGSNFGDIVSSAKKPNQLFHLILDGNGGDIHAAIKGMCWNSTRIIRWPQVQTADLSPLIFPELLKFIEPSTNIDLTVTLHHITEPADYAIFDAFRAGNYSMVIDMVEEGAGVNAFDEWGHTPLMLATQSDAMQVVAALLNARRPKVDVNHAKASGYTALFYATELKSTVVMQALLRKGADPNAVIQQDGSKGNTPLHFTCMLEKPKHAELLLTFGADPFRVNEFNMQPLQLVPADAVRSTKLYFKKLFEESYQRMSSQLPGSGSSNEL